MAFVNTRTLMVAFWRLASAFVAPFAAAPPVGLLLGKVAVAPRVFDGVPVMRAHPRPEPLAVRLLSWPNSGFRNIGRGTKGG